MELFEQIRREYEFGIGTIVGVTKKLSVHRRMVREAIGNALPRPRKNPERPRWKLKAAVQFVDAILEAARPLKKLLELSFDQLFRNSLSYYQPARVR